MENLSEIVGRNLATLRKAKGLTQQELAEEIHYSDKSISKWENGYSLPSVDILCDFAAFYGVTVDYLVKEQKEEDLASIAKTGEREARARAVNHGLIIAMTTMFVVLVALSVFFSRYFSPFSSESPSAEERSGLWIIFVWMVPVILLLTALEVHRFFHHRLTVVILASCFVWTLLISFCIQWAFYNQEKEQIWYILIVGLPIQVILILLGNFQTKKRIQKGNKK